MKRLIGRGFTGLMALGALAVGGTAALATGGRTTPSVLTCTGKPAVKPTSYVLACADAGTYFTALHWKTWTDISATASATLVGGVPKLV